MNNTWSPHLLILVIVLIVHVPAPADMCCSPAHDKTGVASVAVVTVSTPACVQGVDQVGKHFVTLGYKAAAALTASLQDGEKLYAASDTYITCILYALLKFEHYLIA